MDSDHWSCDCGQREKATRLRYSVFQFDDGKIQGYVDELCKRHDHMASVERFVTDADGVSGEVVEVRTQWIRNEKRFRL